MAGLFVYKDTVETDLKRAFPRNVKVLYLRVNNTIGGLGFSE